MDESNNTMELTNEISEENKAPKTNQNNTNKTNILLIGVLVAVILCLAISVTNMALTLTHLPKENDGEEQQGMFEDGQVIASEYEVLSTKHISDAYHSSDTSSLSDTDKETLKMATEVIEECITEDMTDYEKEKAIYDWMVDNIAFDEGMLSVIPTTEDDAHTPYGVLKSRNAICVGYATTFRLFMEMLDIPCRVVINEELYHSWNLVQIEGDWYHTDVYSATGTDDYSCFNLTDSMMTDYWDKSEYPPANSIKYNYNYMNATECTDIYGISAAIRKAFDENIPNLSFRFAKGTDENTLNLAENITFSIENTCVYEDVYYDYTMSHTWFEHNGEYILAVTLSEYTEEDENSNETLSAEDEELIRDALDKAFGDIIDIDNFVIGYDEYYEDEYYDEEDYYEEDYYDEEYFDEEYFDEEYFDKEKLEKLFGDTDE